VENGNEEDDTAATSNGWTVVENGNEEDDIAATTLTNASVDEIPAQLAVYEDCCEQVVGLSEQW
jgi:hypothetical protein